MMRQVSSQVGSNGYTRVQLEQLTRMADQLNQFAISIASLQEGWSLTNLGLARSRSLTLTCPSLNGSRVQDGGHAVFPFDFAIRTCDSQCDDCQDLTTLLSDQAEALTGAYSLYSEAESRMSGILATVLVGPVRFNPLENIRTLAVMTLCTYLGDSLVKGHMVSLAEFLETTSPLHQDTILALSERLVPFSRSPIGHFSEWLSRAMPTSQRRLEVTPVRPGGDGLESAHCIDQALGNLQRLGSRDQGFSYDTIAVQKYRDADGDIRWVVYIPGTSSHPDSAIGWGQNLQLMSDRPGTRTQAASTRLVTEAMGMAGVAPADRVSLVGHSQGGIVAATLASDMADRYRFEHVVTAGSPIGNHPIAPQTWTTSAEMQEELVSSLDARDNTERDHRLTVRGRDAGTTPAQANAPYSRQPVPFTKGTVESTHGMNYQRAAWQNTLAKGSPKIIEQDEHFARSTRGDLVETTYYQGRLRD